MNAEVFLRKVDIYLIFASSGRSTSYGVGGGNVLLWKQHRYCLWVYWPELGFHDTAHQVATQAMDTRRQQHQCQGQVEVAMAMGVVSSWRHKQI